MATSSERKNCIFFDLDGTLVDSLPGIALSVRKALEAAGYPFSQDIGQLIGPPIRQVLRNILRHESEAELDKVELEFRKYYDSEGWKGTLLFPGVQETLNSLKTDGVRLFLFTNKPSLASALILRALNLDSYFEAILSRDSRVPNFATKGAMLKELVTEFDVEKDSAIVTGDSAEDLTAATQLGIRFCFATYGYGKLQAEHASSCKWKIDDFKSLLLI